MCAQVHVREREREETWGDECDAEGSTPRREEGEEHSLSDPDLLGLLQPMEDVKLLQEGRLRGCASGRGRSMFAESSERHILRQKNMIVA